MEEDHTSAFLNACPCHQLRALELRIEEYILWIGRVTCERPPHTNTTAVARHPFFLASHIKL
jgi:hypothetical protein